MKTLYIDAYSGIAGDMLLGAFVDLGIELSYIEQELKKLNLENYTLSEKKVMKNGIAGTKVDVHTDEDHHHRGLTKIKEIINGSELSDDVKEKAIDIFTTLATAEASIHGSTLDEVHFHEVGAIDAIVDIVGNCIALEKLDWPTIVTSPLHVGTGFVKSAHGIIPVPAPATLKMLSTREIETYSKGINHELVTPTGAAIVVTLAESFGPKPQMNIEKIGYGAGTRELKIPNYTRLILGERKKNNFKKQEFNEHKPHTHGHHHHH